MVLENSATFQVFPSFVPDQESWRAWTSRLESHLRLQRCTEEADRVCAIIAYMGSVAYKKLHDKVFPEQKPQDLKFSEIVSTLNNIFEPTENIIASRIAFRKLIQTSGESLLDFEAKLRKGCNDCKWTADELQFNLMEQFIVGLEDKQVKQASLIKSTKFKKLSELFDFATDILTARKTLSGSDAAHSDSTSVHFMKNRASKFNKKPEHSHQDSHRPRNTKCYRCGDKSHLAPNCRHKSSECATCGKVGHIAKVCRSTHRQNFLQEIPFYYVEGDDPLRISVMIEGKPVEMEIDSGSGISTMPLSVFKSLHPNHELHDSDICLRTATGELFKPHSYALVNVSHANATTLLLRLYLIDRPSFPKLFGRQWLRQMNIDLNQLMQKTVLQIETPKSADHYKLKAEKTLKKHENLLEGGIGRIPNMEAKLELTTDTPTPVYHFDIVYKSTQVHGNADALSRLPLKSEDLHGLASTDILLVQQVQNVPLNVKDIGRETLKSRELLPLLNALRNSSPGLEKFFGIDLIEFTLLNQSVIMRGHRVVVPEACRKQVLSELHEGHFGIQKMKVLARQHVWWPSLDKDIHAVSLQCMPCLTNARSPPKTIHHWEPTSHCFQRIHLDYLGPVNGKYILLLVDAHSRWLEAFVTSDKTTRTTLKHLRETVARFGIPSVMVTDNDPTFVSQQMKEFCAVNGITHKTSAPFNPASNGQVERYVGTTKQALRKMSAEGGDLQDNLMRFLFRQHMVISASGKSPSALMFGRELRSRLDLLKERPEKISMREFNDSELRFQPGELVMVRDFRARKPTWITGRVRRLYGSTMCSVDVPNGTWKRNFNQMRKRSQTVATEEEFHAEDDELAVTLASFEDESSPVEDAHDDADGSFHSIGSEHDRDQSLSDENESVQTESGDENENIQTERPNEILRRSVRKNKGVAPVRFDPL